jgi:hypothetical protein
MSLLLLLLLLLLQSQSKALTDKGVIAYFADGVSSNLVATGMPLVGIWMLLLLLHLHSKVLTDKGVTDGYSAEGVSSNLINAAAAAAAAISAAAAAAVVPIQSPNRQGCYRLLC